MTDEPSAFQAPFWGQTFDQARRARVLVESNPSGRDHFREVFEGADPDHVEPEREEQLRAWVESERFWQKPAPLARMEMRSRLARRLCRGVPLGPLRRIDVDTLHEIRARMDEQVQIPTSRRRESE